MCCNSKVVEIHSSLFNVTINTKFYIDIVYAQVNIYTHVRMCTLWQRACSTILYVHHLICLDIFQVVIDLLRIHVGEGSTTRSVMDKLAKDPLLVFVKQLLVEIPMYQELDFMSEILLELARIGLRKWSCDEFPMMKPTHYRLAFLNIRHIPQDQIKYTKTWYITNNPETTRS